MSTRVLAIRSDSRSPADAGSHGCDAVEEWQVSFGGLAKGGRFADSARRVRFGEVSLKTQQRSWLVSLVTQSF